MDEPSNLMNLITPVATGISGVVGGILMSRANIIKVAQDAAVGIIGELRTDLNRLRDRDIECQLEVAALKAKIDLLMNGKIAIYDEATLIAAFGPKKKP